MKAKQNKNKKILLISAVVIAVLALLGVAYGLYIQSSNKNTDANLTASDQNNSSKSSTPDSNSTSDSVTKPTQSNTDTPIPPTKDSSTGKQTVQMVAYTDVSNGTVSIRGGINNAVVNDGMCYAELTGPNGETLRKDTTLLQNASTTDCKTIAINTSSLSKGIWKFTLNYSSDSMEGQSNETSFTIK